MRLNEITEGMKLRAVGDYADCIKVGDEFVAYRAHDALNISCRGDGGVSPGRCHHALDECFADANGEIPELMAAT